MNYAIGLDLGTSNIKAILFDADGREIISVKKKSPITTTEDGHATVDPELILKFAIQALSELAGLAKQKNKKPDILGISCHMHSIMALDREGQPLTPVYLWTDTRAREQASYIGTRDIEDLYARTGCRLDHPMYPVSKILHFALTEKELCSLASRFAGLKDYLLYHLCGEWIIDPGMAGAQGMLNIGTFNWDDKILDILKLSPSRLSQIVPALTVKKLTSVFIANETGLPSGFPVHIGSGDGILANIALTSAGSKMIVSTIGTSGALRLTERNPLLDPQRRTWTYPFDENHWINGGAINNAGLAASWLYRLFPRQAEYDASLYSEDVYETFDRQAESIAPGSNGLVFIPLLTGERSPDWNASVRGMMFGLDYSHGREHLIRAALEGVMFRMCSVYHSLEELHNFHMPLLASGGYCTSGFWLQMQADVFNTEVNVTSIKEASALGAAKTAMTAAGILSTLDNALPVNETKVVIKPDPETADFYRLWYKRVEDIYQRNI